MIATKRRRAYGHGQSKIYFIGLPRSCNFRRATKWAASTAKAGLPTGFHFHDLRHLGNLMAASAGASTGELVHRMGQSTMRAALIYRHATSERDREIADAIDRQIRKEMKKRPRAKL